MIVQRDRESLHIAADALRDALDQRAGPPRLGEGNGRGMVMCIHLIE